MPWLAATALLHSASVLAARDALRAWTIMLGVVAFSMSMLGTFLVRSGILTSVHAFAVDPERGTFILFLLAIYIGGALLLFALRAGAVSEGARFAVASREGALVVNNVLLSAILAVVLLGTLYPLLTEAFDVRVSVGPPYFNPVGAIFALPMVAVMAVGPLLRWRKDGFGRIRKELALLAALLLAVLILVFAPRADRDMGDGVGSSRPCGRSVRNGERKRLHQGTPRRAGAGRSDHGRPLDGGARTGRSGSGRELDGDGSAAVRAAGGRGTCFA